MTTSQTESTSDLRQRANDHIRTTLKYLTKTVIAINELDAAWHLAQERDCDERAALDAAARRLAELLDGKAVSI